MMTLSCEATGCYYVSFCAHMPTALLPIAQRSVGVDVGLTKALARGRRARAIQDAAFGELRRQLAYKSEWGGRVLVEVDRWYPSSKSCSRCQHILGELRLDEREWRCPRCGTCHDRDINAARNLLTEGLRQLAGRDDRDLRVDARGTCPDEIILAQVLAREARSGHLNRACVEQARLG